MFQLICSILFSIDFMKNVPCKNHGSVWNTYYKEIVVRQCLAPPSVQKCVNGTLGTTSRTTQPCKLFDGTSGEPNAIRGIVFAIHKDNHHRQQHRSAK